MILGIEAQVRWLTIIILLGGFASYEDITGIPRPYMPLRLAAYIPYSVNKETWENNFLVHEGTIKLY